MAASPRLYSNAPTADDVVQYTLSAYASLPKHGKPTIRANGIHEWTILASITVTMSPPPAPNHAEVGYPHRVITVALGTGVKVLPAARLPPLGDTVHDCHAEVIARRGFIRWLIDESTKVLSGEAHEGAIVFDGEKFSLTPRATVWLYVSALPCGDASTLHTAAHQSAEMAAIKAAATAASGTATPTNGGPVRGRNGYEHYGAIRTKPGRCDSPQTTSFSCSDKIASWTVLGLQGGLLADIFHPIYFNNIIIGGVEEVPPETASLCEGQTWHTKIKLEVERALWKRVETVQDILPEPYELVRPEIHLTSVNFSYSKPELLAYLIDSPDPTPSAVSLSHVPPLNSAPEVIIMGCRQSSSWKAPGTTLLPDRLRSRLSKIDRLRSYFTLREMLSLRNPVKFPVPSDEATYYQLKHPAESTYQKAKAVLRGVPGEPIPEHWSAVLPHEFSITTSSSTVDQQPPFKGWIVTGEQFESFNRLGKTSWVNPHPVTLSTPSTVPTGDDVIEETTVNKAENAMQTTTATAMAMGAMMTLTISTPVSHTE